MPDSEILTELPQQQSTKLHDAIQLVSTGTAAIDGQAPGLEVDMARKTRGEESWSLERGTILPLGVDCDV